jgi:hypothetical protein
MLVRIVKWFVLIVGVLILTLVVGVGILIVPDIIAERRADITDALVRHGGYDPAEHFTFERACTNSVGDSGDYELHQRGYTRLDPTYPDPDVIWPLVLIDDSNKTYRILFGYDPTVGAPGLVCNSKITLRTETVNGRVKAYIEEARAH